MSRKPATARHRTDTGSAELIDLLRAHGVEYEPLGTWVDGVAWFGPNVVIIDWKAGEKSPLTSRQKKTLARGAPVHFLWNAEQVRLLARHLKQGAPDHAT